MSDLRIIVTRDRFLADRTLSTVALVLPGETEPKPFGFALEDVDRRVEEDLSRKERGATAIGIGEYEVRLYDSPKHGPDTPELVDVPVFRHIQIHPGNEPDDTDGCILIGLARTADRVLKTRAACDWLRDKIREVIEADGTVTCEVRRASS